MSPWLTLRIAFRTLNTAVHHTSIVAHLISVSNCQYEYEINKQSDHGNNLAINAHNKQSDNIVDNESIKISNELCFIKDYKSLG